MPDLISDAAVKKATGKDWAGWVKTLDQLGAEKMTHAEIARMLSEKQLVKSGWWCQMVTVGYEKLKGRRVLGETKDTGFHIGARKTFSVPAKEMWRRLVSPLGWRLWLGPKPKTISTWKPGSHLRFKLPMKGWKKPSTLQLRVIPAGPKKTIVSFHQENLPDAAARAAMKKKWMEALRKIEQHLL